ncbi:RICIN domain-containing protein [Actinoallomurus soli]|uniref:RICIN domain-containing protein n=1 Tax=Actinoallomurus soli TaxID=2952535 RepID=UPI0020932AA8|nr:RICIN domain-containing protein [Actinoallomurus soli]MCO5973966.1 RICIN domain-containing protein [Actinoallomurus soli]
MTNTGSGKPRLRQRLAACWVAVCVAAAGLVGFGATAAHAYGTGMACVFIQPQGAKFAGLNFGHIAWGYQTGTSTWAYGSTENPNGKTEIDAPGYNGAWTASGSWGQMLSAFTLQSRYPSHSVNSQSNSPHPSAPYTKYKCESVANTNVTKANAAAKANITAGYKIATNDCLTAVIRVLQEFNAQNLPSRLSYPSPNTWYDALDSNHWNYVTGQLGETWNNYNSGMYLDITGPSTNNGSKVHQWTWTGADNQWWFRYDSNYGNVFTRYGSNKCMGVSGSSRSAGAPVVEWDCNGSSDQQWIYIPTGGYANGWPLYNIINLNSQQCLGVTGGSKALGAQVVQWPCNGHPDQEWY